MNTSDSFNTLASNGRRFVGACLASCQKLVAQLQAAKDAVLAEFRETRDAQSRLLELALNEAEALAWETGYPHLFFPTLAHEKALAVSAWNSRQQGMLQPELSRRLAA
ncbi:MAG TPA: hypothetical protein VFV96_04960 [Verrucomicrobiae bacterium]|nr:hypothetical protein [Verrucomicrobiae bacterium]